MVICGHGKDHCHMCDVLCCHAIHLLVAYDSTSFVPIPEMPAVTSSSGRVVNETVQTVGKAIISDPMQSPQSIANCVIIGLPRAVILHAIAAPVA